MRKLMIAAILLCGVAIWRVAAQAPVTVVPDCSASAPISLTGSGNTEIVAAVDGKSTRICHISMSSASNIDVKVTSGTGTNCATGNANVTGLYKDVKSFALDFQNSVVQGASGKALCVYQSGSVVSGGIVVYGQK